MMRTTKTTAAGEVEIRVNYAGCDDVRAYLDGVELGSGILPLSAPRTVSGKVLVAYCGKLGLTAEDVAAIERLLIEAKVEFDSSEAGRRLAAKEAKSDRICDRLEEINRKADETDRPDSDR